MDLICSLKTAVPPAATRSTTHTYTQGSNFAGRFAGDDVGSKIIGGWIPDRGRSLVSDGELSLQSRAVHKEEKLWVRICMFHMSTGASTTSCPARVAVFC